MKRSTLVACLAVSLVAGCLVVIEGQTRLTLAQLQRLIAARTPDRIVAAEVAERGLRDTLDAAALETIRKAGAGPETMKALDRIRPRATLNITGLAGTSVAIDGDYIGRISDAGSLTVADLWPGSHEVTATLPDHSPGKQSVTLRANQPLNLEMRLNSIFGFLSLTTDAPRASIDVEGVSQFRDRVSKQRMRVGSYTVRVQAPYRKTHEETITVAPGELLERHITLAPDTEQLTSLLARVAQNYGSRNYRQAAADARDFIDAVGDTNPPARARALSFLALAHLHGRDYAEAATAGAEALAAGETLQFEVTHHHSGFIDPHPARVTVSMYRFQFKPLGTCNVTSGSVDSRLLEVTFPAIRLTVAGQGSWRPVTVKFPKSIDPKDTHTLNFIEVEERRLDAVYGLLRSAAAQRAGALAGAAAVDPSTIHGRYLRVGKSSDFVELNADGTFLVQQDGKTAKGTFSLAGNIMTVQSGKLTDTARVEGTRIVDRQGLVWEKEAPR
jgi:hypothetical protein